MHSLAGLDYDQRGTGEVVCLVHAGVFSAWFAPLFEQPALDRFRVIRPIRPGYGHNPGPSEPASIADHARRCGALLRGLGVTRAHWVGHSNSCCIGLQRALDDPGLVASLILFEPAKPSGAQREAAASTYVGPALAAAANGDTARAFEVFLRGVGGDGYREALRARFGDDALVEAERESAYFFTHELPALAAWTFGPAEAARVTAPALLLCGPDPAPGSARTPPSWPRCCPMRARKPWLTSITSPPSPTPQNSPPPSAHSSATQQPRPPDRISQPNASSTPATPDHVSRSAAQVRTDPVRDEAVKLAL